MAEPLELAHEAYDQRKFDEAREHCERVLEAEPLHAQALLLSGLTAKKQARFEDAIALLEKALAQAANPGALGSLAESLRAVGRLEDALHYIKQYVEVEPANAEAYLLEATILYGLGRYDAALACTLRAKTFLPHSHVVEAQLGCVLIQLGHFEIAEFHFWNAAHIMPTFAHCRLINVRRELWEAIDAGDALRADPAIVTLREARGARAHDAVVAVSCDVQYFYKHGAKFVNSFAQNAAAGKLLHIHVLDPDDRFAAYIDGLLAKVNLPDYTVTTARTAFADSTHYKARRTYYSCVRFLVMPWLVQKYQTTIVCFDVDLVFEQPVDGIISEISGQDIGLVRRKPPDSLWLDFVANVIVVNPTPAALRYFNALGNFVRHFANRDELYWHLDQIALFCVHKMMERFAQPPRTGWFSEAALESVWHIGKANDFLIKQERVARYGIEGLGNTVT
jgi:tetratricopeptide (TPR) repeat protein